MRKYTKAVDVSLYDTIIKIKNAIKNGVNTPEDSVKLDIAFTDLVEYLEKQRSRLTRVDKAVSERRISHRRGKKEDYPGEVVDKRWAKEKAEKILKQASPAPITKPVSVEDPEITAYDD